MADTRTPDRSVSRRTLAKGAAWSVPAVALASAAPALASSIQTPPTVTVGDACKYPGNSCDGYKKAYRVYMSICNPSPVDIWIYEIASSIEGTTLEFLNTEPALPVKIPANNGCVTLVYRAGDENSANRKGFTLNVVVSWSHSANPANDPYTHQPVTVSKTYASTPPGCCGTDASTSAAPAAKSSTSSSSGSISASSSTAAPATSTSEAPASTQASAPTSKSAAPASEAPTSTAAPSGS